MMQIRPISDLRNKFTEMEKIIDGGETVYLTKNGYGTMVLMSMEKYSRMVELSLDEADREALLTDKRYSHEEIFESLRRRIDAE